MTRATTIRAFSVVLVVLCVSLQDGEAHQSLHQLFADLRSREAVVERINALRASAEGGVEGRTSSSLNNVDMRAICKEGLSATNSDVFSNEEKLQVSSAESDSAELRARQTKDRSSGRIAAFTYTPGAGVEKDREAARKFRGLAKKHLEQILAANVKDRTVFHLGLSKAVLDIAKKAKRVIVIEKDPKVCDAFLVSLESVCTLKDTIHLFCMKENGLNKHQKMLAFFSMAETLITEQFKDMPLDVVFTGGDYPLAVALKLFEEIDQSTTVVLHHRLSHDALKALSQLYRQVVLVLPDEMDPDATLSTSVLLLRKKYVQDPAHDLWEKYATEEWRLESDQSALIRFEAVVQDVMEISTSPRRETDGADVSTDKLRVGVLGRTIRAHHHLANDEERAANLRFISELETVVNKYKDESVIKNEHVEDILAVFSKRAQEVAERVGRDSPLKEYFVPLEEAVAATKSVRTKLLLHDMLNDLIVATQKLDTTDSLLEMLEDVIELLNPEMFTTTDLLPNVLHALRMAVASLNDIQDAQMLVADIEKSVFKDAKLETVVKA